MSDIKSGQWQVTRVKATGDSEDYLKLYECNEFKVKQLLSHYQKWYAGEGEHFEARPLGKMMDWNPYPKGPMWINPFEYPENFFLTSEDTSNEVLNNSDS